MIKYKTNNKSLQTFFFLSEGVKGVMQGWRREITTSAESTIIKGKLLHKISEIGYTNFSQQKQETTAKYTTLTRGFCGILWCYVARANQNHKD